MNIEIVEFYPLERNEEKGLVTGTLRIKLSDIGIHILGIYVSKRKEFWYFSMPGRNGIHHGTGEQVRFPFIVFEDREKHRELMEAIKEKGRAFIEKRLGDTEKPLIFQQKTQQVQKQLTRERNSVPGAKEMAFIEKQKPAASITTKEWRDLPPRKTQARTSSNCFRK